MLTASRNSTAKMVPSLTTSFLPSSRQSSFPPPFATAVTRHAIQSWPISGLCLTSSTVLSKNTNTTEKKMTSQMMMSTIAMPFHCSAMTLRTRRYACLGVIVRMLPVYVVGSPEPSVEALVSASDAR